MDLLLDNKINVRLKKDNLTLVISVFIVIVFATDFHLYYFTQD